MNWKMFVPFLPMIIMALGTMIKEKDKNDTGADDAFGNVVMAAAPAIGAFQSGDQSATKKFVRALRDTCNGYLGE